MRLVINVRNGCLNMWLNVNVINAIWLTAIVKPILTLQKYIWFDIKSDNQYVDLIYINQRSQQKYSPVVIYRRAQVQSQVKLLQILSHLKDTRVSWNITIVGP